MWSESENDQCLAESKVNMCVTGQKGRPHPLNRTNNLHHELERSSGGNNVEA